MENTISNIIIHDLWDQNILQFLSEKMDEIKANKATGLCIWLQVTLPHIDKTALSLVVEEVLWDIPLLHGSGDSGDLDAFPSTWNQTSADDHVPDFWNLCEFSVDQGDTSWLLDDFNFAETRELRRSVSEASKSPTIL